MTKIEQAEGWLQQLRTNAQTVGNDAMVAECDNALSALVGLKYELKMALAYEQELALCRKMIAKPPEPEPWEICQHQYWDIGYCIDCGIHSNDPRYVTQLSERRVRSVKEIM